MTRKQALELRQKFSNAVQAIPKNSTKIYDAFPLFDEWEAGVTYAAKTKIRYNGLLYITGDNEHTSQADWTPDITPALYTVIPMPGEDGTADNPYNYNGNMILYNGKYYRQDGVIYYCFRDSVNPVFNPLSELVDLYVNVYA